MNFNELPEREGVGDSSADPGLEPKGLGGMPGSAWGRTDDRWRDAAGAW